MKNKKLTLVDLVAQVISLTNENTLKKSDMFWKRHRRQADAAVYTVFLALKYPSLYNGKTGLLPRPIRRPR